MILETNNGVKLTFSENTIISPDETIGYELSDNGSQVICGGKTTKPLILIDESMNLAEVNLDGYYMIHESKIEEFLNDKMKQINY